MSQDIPEDRHLDQGNTDQKEPKAADLFVDQEMADEYGFTAQ